ncbi:MAG: histidinol-phosphatase [Blastopirellula sp.]|nr:histidinol-phosphatase [Blastopirellula sp.]
MPMSAAVFYESHSHTPLCKHATGEPEEYAAVAAQRGLHGLIITCHNPMPDGFSAHVRMAPEQFDEYVDMIARARETWAGRVDVRMGLEADYFEGYEPWLEKQLSSSDFHHVLGSVHPQIAEFKERYWNDDAFEFQQTYFKLLAQSAETGLFDTLAHPDLIKNQTADAWCTDKIMSDIKRALDRIARTGVAMELNTSGLNKKIAEMNPFPEMLGEMRARQIPVVIGADAHVPERVGDRYLDALDLLSRCGYESVSFFLERQRRDVPISEARECLSAAEPAPTS